MRAIVALALVLPTLGIVTASALGEDCDVFTSNSVQLGQFHLWLPPSSTLTGPHTELWQESNALPGLQRGSSTCSDGSRIPADACLTHSNTQHLPTCVFTYPGPTV